MPMNMLPIVAAVGAIAALLIGLRFFKLPGVLLCALGLCGLALAWVSMDKSTTPSSARRITVVGQSWDWTRHDTTRRHWWTFVLKASPTARLLLKTPIDIPESGPGKPDLGNGDTVRIIYLDETTFVSDPRAIRIEVVSGSHAGWVGSVGGSACRPERYLPFLPLQPRSSGRGTPIPMSLPDP